MLNKLAIRNAKRSAKDYIIYLLTMAIIAALMFAFDSMIFSKDIKKLYSDGGGIMAIMLSLATVFIIFIIAWLIHYMIRFMLEKRSREFGTYMLMGMKKKEIAKMFIRENLFLGAAAFLMGLVPGIFFQQVLTTIFYQIFGQHYYLDITVNGFALLMTVCLYSAVYFFALLKNKRRFKKMDIHDLVYLDKQNQQLRKKDRKSAAIWVFLSIIYFAVFTVFLFTGKFTIINIWFMLLGLIIAVYFFYAGLSGLMSMYIDRRGRKLYKGANLFLLRQMASKIKTMRFTMGTLTILFSVALIGCCVAMMFSDYQKKELEAELPFDIIVFSDLTNDHFKAQRDIIHKETDVNSERVYNIYEDGKTDVNSYLYKNLPYFENQTPVKETESDQGNNEYFDYDTYMKLSDYNALRHMLGLESVTLENNGYIIQTKERIEETLIGFQKTQTLTATGKTLQCQGIITDSFAQSGENGADYVLVVSDHVAEKMTPFYSLMAVDIKGDAPDGLQERLAATQNYYDDETGNMNTDITWGFGTNEVITMADTVLVKSNLVGEMRFIMTSLSYPLFYVGIVFLCVAMTILSVQQLSDAAKYKYRYEVLSKLGLREKEINRIVLKQLSAYYMCPMLAAIILSGMISIFASQRFVFYTGISTPVLFYYGISLAIFLSVYLIYFIATYSEFKKSIHHQAFSPAAGR